mmetsp:Transcript_6575/g.27122  ORF Transcript_6575/g.27122 Transcript_6575/m.27122 type:complete len:372 (+) Transcript_6575:3479-4594(+)
MALGELLGFADVDQHALLAVDQLHRLGGAHAGTLRSGHQQGPQQHGAGDQGGDDQKPVLDQEVQASIPCSSTKPGIIAGRIRRARGPDNPPSHCLTTAHVQARPDPPRRIDLEPGKPLHRLDRRRPDAHRRRAGQASRPAAEGSRLRLRHRLHLGAQARGLDAVALPGPDGPHLAAGAPRLAPERTPLRRAAGPEQGRHGQAVRRRAGADLAPQLRHPAAGPGADRPAQRTQRPPLPRPGRRRHPADRMPEGHGRPRAAVLERDRCPSHPGRPARADRGPRQQHPGPGQVPRRHRRRRHRRGQHPQRHPAGLRARRRPQADQELLPRRRRSRRQGRRRRGRPGQGLSARDAGPWPCCPRGLRPTWTGSIRS